MALNPLRDRMAQLGRSATRQTTPFEAETDAALERFRALRADLERQVKRGELTLKVARDRAASAAAELRADLRARGAGFSPSPRVFFERLVQAVEHRQAAAQDASLEALQRETNRLLREALIEQQMTTRAPEFRSRAYVRPLHGGQPVPTLDSLLSFHEHATAAGDAAAQEWARRELEGLRSQMPSPEDQRRIDAACDRPDRVNPATVTRYVEALRESEPEAIETFVAQALDARDANACCAAFLLARDEPRGTDLRWARAVLEGLGSFPDAALNTLRTWEAEARRAEADAARAKAEYAIALIEADAGLEDVTPPTEENLQRQARLEARPVAAPHQPIGLNLAYRGLKPEEFASLQAEVLSDGEGDGDET